MKRRTLQFGSSEILENLLPIRRVVIPSQVRLELPAKDLKSSTLSNTVGTNKAQNLTRTGHWQTVELEAVGRVAVRHLRLEVGGQVDNVDGAKGAFFRADTASNAQLFRDKGDFRFWRNLDAKLSGAHDRARFLAFLATFLRQSSKRLSSPRTIVRGPQAGGKSSNDRSERDKTEARIPLVCTVIRQNPPY